MEYVPGSKPTKVKYFFEGIEVCFRTLALTAHFAYLKCKLKLN